jgi:hypothetical protein
MQIADRQAGDEQLVSAGRNPAIELAREPAAGTGGQRSGWDDPSGEHSDSKEIDVNANQHHPPTDP